MTLFLRPARLFFAVALVCQALTVSPFAYSQDALQEVDFGAVNMGGSSPAITLTFTFGKATTLGSVSVLTQGASGLDFANARTGTCTKGTNYNAGDSCTVSVTFTPILAGVRHGAVALTDGVWNVIAVQQLDGIGVGPQLNLQPNTENKSSTSAVNASGTAVDTSGNVNYSSNTSITCTSSTTPALTAGICTIQSLTANLSSQTITFGAIPAQAVNTSVGVTLTATASSGLTVSFTSVTPAICT
ncbi:MAG: hypothetical protein ABSF70_16075, partial [Terracidiphilus sp.]